MTDTYVGDAPIKDSKGDIFRRWPFAQRVAQTIAGRLDPGSLVIGIYGAWGEGKTTVLNFIDEELRKHGDIVCFRFNPWRFPEEAALLTNFFRDLIEALGKSLSTKKEKLGALISKYGTAPAAILGRGEAAKSLGQFLSSVELEELRDRVEAILKDEGKRVVVLMDDIDRLDKVEIQAVFRLIKLSVDFDYTAYVLAFDDEMVASALQERYGAKDSNAGRNFLEKIVQVPLRLPSVSPSALRGFCFQSVDQALNQASVQLSEDDIRAFVRQFVNGLEIRLKTPRMAKRYGNILAFALPIMKGEVNTVDFMVVEGIRIFYPELYAVLKDHREPFTGEKFAGKVASEQQKKVIIDIVETGLVGLGAEEREAAMGLLMDLFPRLYGVFGNQVYGGDWDVQWGKEQRIASRSYFSRYFSYAIPEGDFSDMDMDSFIATLPEVSSDKISERLKQLISPRTAVTVTGKLRSKIGKIASGDSEKLASAIARNGSLFPVSRSLFSYQGAFSQAAMLASDLIENIQETTSRLSFARNLLHEAEPITFAVEIHRWIRAGRKDQSKAFSAEQQSDLDSVLAARIKEIATQDSSFISQFSDDIPILMEIWASWGSPAETDGYIRKIVDADAALAVSFLKCYVPTQWGMESGLPSKGDFERRHYDSVIQVVSPDVIFDALRAIYGARLDVQDFPYSDGKLSDERVAQQFAWLHDYVLQKAKEQGLPEGDANEESRGHQEPAATKKKTGPRLKARKARTPTKGVERKR
jgi:hypothetical protein